MIFKMANIIVRLLVIEKTENGGEKKSRATALQLSPTVSKGRFFKIHLLEGVTCLIFNRRLWLLLGKSSEQN